MHAELISIARDLASREAGRPKNASLARAVSSAYYALFHRLAWHCAEQSIGKAHWEEFKIAYRAIDHGRSKAVFSAIIKDSKGIGDLSAIGRAFITLQGKRHEADYDIGYRTSRQEVRDLIDLADDAVALSGKLGTKDSKHLTARLISGRARS